MRLTAFYLIVSFRVSYCFIVSFTLSERVSYVNSYLYSQEMKVSVVLIVLIGARPTSANSNQELANTITNKWMKQDLFKFWNYIENRYVLTGIQTMNKMRPLTFRQSFVRWGCYYTLLTNGLLWQIYHNIY